MRERIVTRTITTYTAVINGIDLANPASGVQQFDITITETLAIGKPEKLTTYLVNDCNSNHRAFISLATLEKTDDLYGMSEETFLAHAVRMTGNRFKLPEQTGDTERA